MTTRRTDDDGLERLLAEARAQRPVPSAALMARIAADAQAVARAAAPARVAARPFRRLSAAVEALGGRIAAAGLAAAAVTGLSLGALQPAPLADAAAALWGDPVSVTLGLDDDPLGLLGG